MIIFAVFLLILNHSAEEEGGDKERKGWKGANPQESNRKKLHRLQKMHTAQARQE